jgi:spore coat protein U-like protein
MLHTFKAVRTACLMATVCATFFAVSSAQAAGSDTDNLDVTVTVPENCTIVQNDAVDFGNYANAQIDAAGELEITCNNGLAYEIGLDGGSNADVANREMTGDGLEVLSYAIFSDAGRTTNWGNTGGVDTLDGTGTGSAVQIPVYGRLAAGQGTTITAGAYADTLTATISW